MTAPIPDEAVEAAARDLREVATTCVCGSNDGDNGTCTCPSVFEHAVDGHVVVEVHGLVEDIAHVAVTAAAPHIRAPLEAEVERLRAQLVAEPSRRLGNDLAKVAETQGFPVTVMVGSDINGGTIPCQVYLPGPHGERLCVRAINEAPPCCFPASEQVAE